MHQPLVNSKGGNINDAPVYGGTTNGGKKKPSADNPHNVGVLSHELPGDEGTFGNPYCRFTILFAFLVVGIGLLPLILAAACPKIAAYVGAGGMLFFALWWLVIALNALRNYTFNLDRAPIASWEESLTLRERRFKHIVIVPCYLDPLDVLHNCIGTLVFQQRTEDLIVVVTFEKKTPDLDMKVKSITEAFSDKFGDLLVVVHALQPMTEIPGGCSNKNFAIREAYKYLVQSDYYKKIEAEASHKFHRVTITTCDTDSRFHPQFFETVVHSYNAENPCAEKPVRMNVWQPPVFYNWDLDERPFFNRVTCIMRTMMMLGGLISFNINPMSIFTYPVELGYKAGIINPRYGVDDIIAKVRWMCSTNTSVPVKILPVIAISGPTIGTTFMEEVHEWGRQIRRWIVGASESFHYFIIHWRGRPFFSGIQWFFTFFMYYAVLLCCAGIFSIFASIPFPWVEYPTLYFGPNDHTGISFRYAGAVCLGIQMVAFGIGFVIDALGARYKLNLKEDISILRNLAHWLVSPIVLIVYSVIAFVSIVRFMYEGKKMAGHDMAAKAGLKAESPTTAAAAAVVQSKHNEPEQVVHIKSTRSMGTDTPGAPPSGHSRVEEGESMTVSGRGLSFRDSFVSSHITKQHHTSHGGA